MGILKFEFKAIIEYDNDVRFDTIYFQDEKISKKI